MPHDSTTTRREGLKPASLEGAAEPNRVNLGEQRDGGHKPVSPHGSKATNRFTIREKSKIIPSPTQSLSAVQQHRGHTI